MLYPQITNLKCAYGSSLSVIGYTVVPIQIADSVQMIKFTVVKQIFPKIILGMNFMRKFKIIVNAPKSQISFINDNGNQIIVPFVSSLQENF